MEYGLNGGPGRTVGLTQAITYQKEPSSKTGMRKHYNAERGLELVHRYPRNARIVEGPATSSMTSKTRGIRHRLNTKGFTPIRITDRDRYAKARADIENLVKISRERIDLEARKKIAKRAGRSA